jgi:hypothetical protein
MHFPDGATMTGWQASPFSPVPDGSSRHGMRDNGGYLAPSPPYAGRRSRVSSMEIS